MAGSTPHKPPHSEEAHHTPNAMHTPNISRIQTLVRDGHPYETAERIDRLEQEENDLLSRDRAGYLDDYDAARLADVQRQLRKLEAQRNEQPA